MPKSKHKPSATEPALEVAKPGLEVKPVTDLEPDESQSENVRGGIPAGGGKVAGLPPRFSDAALKSRVAPLRDALAKLRELRF